MWTNISAQILITDLLFAPKKIIRLIVGLTNAQQSNLYQSCSIVNFKLKWDRAAIDAKVPGEEKAYQLHEILN